MKRVFTPKYVLNFKDPKRMEIFNVANCRSIKTMSSVKIAHAALLSLSVYSLVQAYRKRRYFRGIFLWLPLCLFFAGISTTAIMKYRYVKSIKLHGNGKAIDIWTKPLWQSKLNLPIQDIETMERDELVTLLADHEMLLASNSLLPIKLKS